MGTHASRSARFDRSKLDAVRAKKNGKPLLSHVVLVSAFRFEIFFLPFPSIPQLFLTSTLKYGLSSPLLRLSTGILSDYFFRNLLPKPPSSSQKSPRFAQENAGLKRNSVNCRAGPWTNWLSRRCDTSSRRVHGRP